MSLWISDQNKNYKRHRKIMKYKYIRIIWKNFINDKEYNKYFTNIKTTWRNNLDKVKQYICINNKKPSISDKSEYVIQLARWIYSQQRNFKNKNYNMKNPIFYNKWVEFINDDKYKKYFYK